MFLSHQRDFITLLTIETRKRSLLKRNVIIIHRFLNESFAES